MRRLIEIVYHLTDGLPRFVRYGLIGVSLVGMYMLIAGLKAVFDWILS